MKYTILALLSVCVLTGCASSPAQMQALVNAVQAASADGVITPEETQLIVAQMPKPAFDWLQVAEVVGSIGASILGVKFIPEKHLRSPLDPAPPPA